ncbi:CHAT domain-containing protein [Streptomyces sioyaensis]|uniref:CHAT domain-containing protein n=1 Tax=Streptomyces sioyaensis TaxID=67364 RepID=UPI0036E8F211
MPQPNDNSAEDRRIEAIMRLWQADGLGDDGQSAWKQARHVFQEYQDALLDDAAENAFGRAVLAKIEEIEQKDIGDVPRTVIAHSLGEKWHLLRRCRQVGIANAFSEKENRLFDDWKWDFANFYSLCERAGDWAVIKNLLCGQYRHLRTPQGRKFLAVARWHQSARMLGSLTLDELFDRIEVKGIDASFEDLIQFGTDVPPAMRRDLQDALDATEKYHEARDRISLRDAVQKWEDVVKNTHFRTASLHTQRTYLVEAGNAHEYLHREHGKDCDLSRAIELWHESSEVGAREGHADSAEFLHYLGYSHERRHRSATASRQGAAQGVLSDIDLAIKYYDQAYDVADAQYGSGILPAPMEDSPDGFEKALWRRRQRARYRNAAGLAYLERYRTSQAVSDLKAAVLRCRQATKLAEEEDHRAPFLYDDLAQALETRYAVIGSPVDALAALDAYRRALEWCDDGVPVFGLEAATHYGLLLYNLGKVAQAREELETAHTWAQKARFEQKTRRGRLQLAGLMTDLYATLVTCCLRDDDEESAFRYATAAKGRSLVDSLFAEGVDLDHMVQKQSKDASDTAASDRNDYLRVRKDIAEAKAQLDWALGPEATMEEPDPSQSAASLCEDLVGLRHEEKILWDDLVSRYPDLAAMRDVDPMAPADARRLSGDLGCALVEYYRHRDGWCAFVVTTDRVVCRPLLEVNDPLLDDLTVWVQDAAERGPGSDVLMRWYDAVLRPLRADLPPRGTVIIAPYGPMHRLPYAAGIERDSGQYAIDEFAMGFTPSLSALDRIWQRGDTDRRLRSQPVSKVLGIAYPDPPNLNYDYLDHATAEVAAVLGCFGGAEATTLLDEQTIPEVVLREARGQDVIHFCCHGVFNSRFPAQSGLFLNNGWLTARGMATELDLSGTRLFTMGACSTAEASISVGDELEGLTQAALTAGAPTVVATLWEVNHVATEVLLTSFYQHLARGSAPIHAMRAAAHQLREERPGSWSHPYFWSGLVVSGLGHLPLGPPATETRRSDGQSEAPHHTHPPPAQ